MLLEKEIKMQNTKILKIQDKLQSKKVGNLDINCVLHAKQNN